MATSTATRGRITTTAGYVIAGIGERIVGVIRVILSRGWVIDLPDDLVEEFGAVHGRT
jgi:hypothetical protein